jgi:BioD-like phosphotransacetylase family protein
MACVFIGSTGDHAGQTLLAWALGRRLMEMGLRVSLFKPFATHPLEVGGKWTDRDAVFFKEALRLDDPLERICPFVPPGPYLTETGPEVLADRIVTMANEISSGVDILLVMGFQDIFFDDVSHPVPDTSLINALGARLLLVTRYQEASTSIYSILSIFSLVRDKVKGIVLNRVPPEKLELVRGQFLPFLIQKGVPISACLPEDPMLGCRSLREVLEVVDGELLTGDQGLDLPVAGMTVGSADLEGGLTVFKRVYNKVVLVGPVPLHASGEEVSRPRSVVGILLTSQRMPPPVVLEAARRAGVSLALVKDDTFAALDRLQRSSPSLSPADEGKVLRFTELLDLDHAFEKLMASLGIFDPRI